MKTVPFDACTINRIAQMGQQHYTKHRQLVANTTWMALCLLASIFIICASFSWPPMTHVRIPTVILAAPLGILIALRAQLCNQLTTLIAEIAEDLDKVCDITAIERNFRSRSFTIHFNGSRCDISDNLVHPSAMNRFVSYLAWQHHYIKFS